jgi:hypothetical protein
MSALHVRSQKMKALLKRAKGSLAAAFLRLYASAKSKCLKKYIESDRRHGQMMTRIARISAVH